MLQFVNHNRVNDYLLGAYYASELIMYPVSTAFKRLISQVNRIKNLEHNHSRDDSHSILITGSCRKADVLRRGSERTLEGIYAASSEHSSQNIDDSNIQTNYCCEGLGFMKVVINK